MTLVLIWVAVWLYVVVAVATMMVWSARMPGHDENAAFLFFCGGLLWPIALPSLWLAAWWLRKE